MEGADVRGSVTHRLRLCLLAILACGGSGIASDALPLGTLTEVPASRALAETTIAVYRPQSAATQGLRGCVIVLLAKDAPGSSTLVEHLRSGLCEAERVTGVVVTCGDKAWSRSRDAYVRALSARIAEIGADLGAPLDRCALISWGATDAIAATWLSTHTSRGAVHQFLQAVLVEPSGQGPTLAAQDGVPVSVVIGTATWIANRDRLGETARQRMQELTDSTKVVPASEFRIVHDPAAGAAELSIAHYRRALIDAPPIRPATVAARDQRLWSVCLTSGPYAAVKAAKTDTDPIVREMIALIDTREAQLMNLIDQDPAQAWTVITAHGTVADLVACCRSDSLRARLKDVAVVAHLERAHRFRTTIAKEFASIWRYPPATNPTRRGLLAVARGYLGENSQTGISLAGWLDLR